MSSDRFHRAAKDGLLDVLSKATRNEANAKDDDSMTPVLWAAFEGRLDALRLLCGRGGDADKCDQFGNTALHLAAAKGHIHCVDFLIKFGVNIYALDIDKHSAKDLAAINNRDDILRYLDAATTNFEAKERKKAKALKELAEKNCEKRMREYMKRQQKLEHEYNDVKLANTNAKSTNVLSSLKQKIWSSQGNLNKSGGSGNNATGTTTTTSSATSTMKTTSTKYSDLVDSGSSSTTSGSRMGTVQKKTKTKTTTTATATTNKGKTMEEQALDSGFKIGEIEADGKRTITSLTGLQRDSEILYVGTFSSNEETVKRGKISDVFEMDETREADKCHTYNNGTLSRSFSQPDFLSNANNGKHDNDNDDDDVDDDDVVVNNENPLLQRPAGLFERPMLGSIAFRRSVTAALSHLNSEQFSMDVDEEQTKRLKSRNGNKSRSFLNISDSDSDGIEAFSEDDQDVNTGTPIQRFLTVWGLDEYLNVFQKQEIDLDTLMLLTEADLKSLGLPLGPFRKLTFAIQERRNALANPGPMQDSQL